MKNRVVIAAVGIVLAVVLGFAAYDRYEDGTTAPLAVPKAWEARALALGNARASMRTLWREGRISYQLRVEPPPSEIAAAIRSTTTVRQHFTVEFLDADGFRLLSLEIEPRELGLVLRPDGTVAAIEARGDKEMLRDVYRSAERWDIRWSFH
jgi:hypothetical protein